MGKILGMDTSWKGIRKGLGGIKKNMAKNYGVRPKSSKVKRRRLY